MKVTEIGTKVKQKIRLVADHLKSNLTCPKYKFVLEMLAGIISTGGLNLERISGSLKETISCRHTHKRLCRQVQQNGELMQLINDYILHTTSSNIRDTTCIYLDGGDITYASATSYEYMSKVKDGSTGGIKDGYVSNLVVCKDNQGRVFPVCYNIYHRHTGYESDNKETLKIIDLFLSANGNNGVWVLDRGYDNGYIIDKLLSNNCNFIIRMVGTRHLVYKDEKVIVNDLAKNNPLKYHYKYGEYHYKKCYYKGHEVTMIYYKKKNVDMKLLVSGHIQRKKEIELCLERYFQRWCVEDGHRFIKQAFMLEKSRASKFESIKCLAGLAILAWYVLYKIANDEALKYELLEQSKTTKPKKVAFDYYRIIRGIQEVFKLLTEMFRFRTYKHKETQLSIEDFLCKYDRFVYL